jgi:fluoroquinolone resistance protein
MRPPFFKKQSEYFDQRFEKLELPEQVIIESVFENCTFLSCNLSEGHFQNVKFCDCTFENCNLSNIKIKGCSFHTVEFIKSKIVGVNWCEATWPTIKLSCPIHFSECDLSHSTFLGLNLRDIKLTRCRIHDVDFREADLTYANLTYSDFSRSLFMNSNLTEADFSYAESYRINLQYNKVTRAKFMLPEAVGLLYGLDIELIDAG